MPKIKYQDFNFRADTLDVISKVNNIVSTYAAQGFSLTLRQVYYQFVSRGWIANTEREYKRLGSIINDGRVGGLIDWKAIEDRTRALRDLPHWDDPSSIVDACASQFRVDKWERQPHYCEIWIEKDALVGVIEDICNEMDVAFFSCRGYTSQSEMWNAAMRLKRKIDDGKEVTIFHLGDHDPSGIDMSRDIQERLSLFSDHDIELQRLALNMDQVRKYKPPPNPAKLTDARCDGYIALHGSKSWELDALEPRAIVALVREAIHGVRDQRLWKEAMKEEEGAREELKTVAENWEEAVAGAQDA
jgi:hypothetical protein